MTSPAESIVTLTLNPTIDKSASIAHVVPERKLRCGPPRYEPGGGGINVSRAVAKLGGASTALYLAGGRSGQRLQDLLDAEGLTHRAIPLESETRENLIIYEEATGQQYRFGMPGPQVDEAARQGVLDALSGGRTPDDFVVVSGSLPPGISKDFLARLASLCRDTGAKLVVDTSGEALAEAVKAGVFLVKPNIDELKTLAGRNRFDDETHLEDLARGIVSDGGSRVVVTSLGAGGAMAVWEDGCERIHAPTVPIQSKVGAGDSMVAGIVLALARGEALLSAVRFGVAAGAAAVMTPGTELCRREDTERLYRKITGE